ncbi:hypothetical protein [Pseudolactococcus insecticola]|uniref:Uncharacterized protein n=1 Tax=Pseudolactococcus insecticola TaxID=2709158 RepID=A0A6A0BC33_9LACT|nr:hypothetical protein [Lactococcus insecticola]GFH41367.1 hypothetical protein Hs20B_17650 [Lactococcus insecticola]
MKKIMTCVIVLCLTITYLIIVPSGIYIKPQVRQEVELFISNPEKSDVVASTTIREKFEKMGSAKVKNISDPQGGNKKELVFAFEANHETYTVVMAKHGLFSWRLKEIY